MSEKKSLVYLNTAACGLIPEPIMQAGFSWYSSFTINGSTSSERWRNELQTSIKADAAALLNTAPKNVALIPNFSFTLNAVVQSLKGDEKVLLYRKDYPSLYIPFVINNFDITWIDDEDGFFIDPEKISAVIKEKKINIVAISHVQYQSGFRADLAQLGNICRDNNALLIVDATQSLGAIETDMSALPVDVLIASNYKWMNAGYGNGLLYMNETFLATYPPKISGNNSQTFRFTDDGYVNEVSINNYEPGSLDMFGFMIMQASLAEKNKTGIRQIAQHNFGLAQKLLSGLASLPVRVIGGQALENRCSIISVEETGGLHAWLSQNNIITTLRNGLVRISAHYYNTDEDIDAILHCISDWSKR